MVGGNEVASEGSRMGKREETEEMCEKGKGRRKDWRGGEEREKKRMAPKNPFFHSTHPPVPRKSD